MLRPPTFSETPQLSRFPDGHCTWFGQPCCVLSVINEGTSLSAICFVHQNFADEAMKCHLSGESLSSIFEVSVLPGMKEFHDFFLCVGLYRDGNLIGVWDMPLHWMSGAKLLGSDLLVNPRFRALMNAAQDYADAHPADKEDSAETQ